MRPLENICVGISISGSREIASLGFDDYDVNRFVVLLSDVLLGAGARLIFGHDWRPGGVMEAVAESAARYSTASISKSAKIDGLPLIVNRVAYPEVPFFEDDTLFASLKRDLLDGIVNCESVALDTRSGSDEVDRANGLSALREKLNALADFRVCIGGNAEGFQGWFPGVAEEASLALRDGKPVMFGSLFGGVSAFISDSIVSGKRLRFNARAIPQAAQSPNSLIIDPDFISKRKDSIYMSAATSIDQAVEEILRDITTFKTIN